METGFFRGIQKLYFVRYTVEAIYSSKLLVFHRIRYHYQLVKIEVFRVSESVRISQCDGMGVRIFPQCN